MRIRPRPIVAATAVLVIAGGAAHAGSAASGGPPTAAREVLAQVVDPPGAKGRTLALARVTIPPRTALALHRHPGAQIAHVERGTLTYTVREGVVEVHRGAADGASRVVRRVGPGQTGTVRAGEWVVERPGDVHFGANRGRRTVEILLASLFTTGSPASIPVE